MMKFPKIIQGGMGVGVSNWRLANVVAKLGQLGVVSGTALDSLFVRRLNEGDPGGHMRRGLDAFPFPEMAQRIWDEYYIPGGKAASVPYALPPMHQRRDMRKVVELCIVSNFVEVYLARDGHKNPVGINFLEKVQMPHLSSIYGAMLAGVGYVLMGAGIPLHIPGVLDALAGLRPAQYHLAVTGAAPDTDTAMNFDPADYVQGALPQLDRPKFLAIVSSNTLATTMLRRATGRVDGLVLETPIAGGHNAPPRGKLQLNANGEPIYGERDQVDLAGLRALGVPFWMAGGYGNAQSLRYALDQGAAGVQVGTAFAFSEESGMRADLKNELIAQAVTNSGVVFTDPLASPTGFPFKVAILQGSYSDTAVAEARTRVCDIGLLRESYVQPNGKIGYRCSAEPVANYVAKGGKAEETVGRKCLCNALMANIGHGQTRKDGSQEPPLITVGDDLNTVAQFLAPGRTSYSAADVVRSLLSLCPEPVAEESIESALTIA
ncbi:MAG TPA: nitronate monooxygenase [Terracidiphilus sp.]|jgi:nitronate monooxygenase